jgi:uncharacterized protein (DUF1697 family)
MKTYISILRGINVSGQKKILMADLKEVYESLGFTNVVTYIQSGNVLFNSDNKYSENELKVQIKKAIEEKYDFQVPIIVFSIEFLKNIVSNNPFLKEREIDIEKLHVTYLVEIPSKEKLELIKNVDFSPDRFSIIDSAVYVYCPGGYGKTKLSNTFFETKLKVKATTRNWKTTLKLIEVYISSKLA